MSASGTMPPAEHQHVVEASLVELVDHPREQRHVRAGQDREADRVGVFLQ